VLVVEKVIPPGNASFPGKLTDITMLLVAGGRERTAKEYEALLTGAGLTLTRIVPTSSPASVISSPRGCLDLFQPPLVVERFQSLEQSYNKVEVFLQR